MGKKRKNKSRLTRTDVNTICEMQRKIDAYENYIISICGMIQHKDDLKFRPILIECDTPMDAWMNISWVKIQEMKKELIELKENKS